MHASSTTSLAQLRRMLPSTVLSLSAALLIAERQANRLVAAWTDGDRAVREADIASLTTLDIRRGPVHRDESGSSRYAAGRWLIQLSATDGATRQRFTLAHELKHIIDAGSDTNAAYARLSDRQIERVCDHFAACLLMNKRLVYRLWGDGLRTPEALARACNVSLQAILVRLDVLKLPINRADTGAAVCRDARRSAKVPRFTTVTALEGALA